MGVKSLNTLVSNFTNNGEKKIHLSKLSGYKLAIDTNLYLYKYLYGNKNHVNGIFFMINKLKKFNITPIFVFDGKPPDEKKNKILERKIIKEKINTRLLNLKLDLNNDIPELEKNAIIQKIENLEKRVLYIDKDVIDKTIQLFDIMGVAYIKANCEAEQYCSKLSRLNLVDGVISEDTDTLACGSKIVIRDFSNKSDFVLCYNLDEILYDLDINYASFLDICILLGTDYNSRTRGLSPEQIYQHIKTHKNIENLIKNKIISSVNFDYVSIRSILNLDSIKLDILKLLNQLKKIPNIDSLPKFLEEFSSIEEKTYKHRINLLYKKKTLICKSKNSGIDLSNRIYKPSYVYNWNKKSLEHNMR